MNQQHLTSKHLSQTDKLIHYLRNGNSTNFLDAFHRFEVQDFRKRLQEIREAGYRLTARHEHPMVGAFRCTMLSANQQVPKVLTYRIDKPLKPGDYVEVINAPSIFGVHPLKGRVGRVLEITDKHLHIVGDDSGKPFGQFRHKDLKKRAAFGHGQRVGLSVSAYTVSAYDASTDRYVLRNETATLAVPAEAVRALQ